MKLGTLGFWVTLKEKKWFGFFLSCFISSFLILRLNQIRMFVFSSSCWLEQLAEIVVSKPNSKAGEREQKSNEGTNQTRTKGEKNKSHQVCHGSRSLDRSGRVEPRWRGLLNDVLAEMLKWR